MVKVVPSSTWAQPAKTWVEVIDRYVSFVQIPSWRASVNRDGSDRRGHLEEKDAQRLASRMAGALNAMAGRRSGAAVETLIPTKDDLIELHGFVKRQSPKADRCSARIHWHFQRAYLLNAQGYRCVYCRRSVSEVWEEETGSDRRTLRFEIDHLVTRRRLDDPKQFDAGNLVAACRSCNTIKAEMTEKRFRRELQSLALGFAKHHAKG